MAFRGTQFQPFAELQDDIVCPRRMSLQANEQSHLVLVGDFHLSERPFIAEGLTRRASWI